MSKNVTGWLTPSGDFISCSSYNHHNIVTDPRIRQWIWEWAEWLEDIESSEAGCKELKAEGEHPEWHNYEMACSSIGSKMCQAMKQRGFLRVGTMGDQLHFEGKPDAFMMEAAKYLAEVTNKTAVFDGNV